MQEGLYEIVKSPPDFYSERVARARRLQPKEEGELEFVAEV